MIGTVLVGILSSLPASASPAHTPTPGSSERRAILDALRQPVDKEMKQTVVFHDVFVKAQNGWAYVSADVRDSSGHTLRYFSGSPLDFTFQGLLRRTKTGWRVLDWGYGTGTDPTDNARKKYPAAPASIFPYITFGAQSVVSREKPAPSGWSRIATFSGGIDNPDTKTVTFRVGSRWKIDWTTQEGKYGSQGTITVFVKTAPNAPYSEATGMAVSHSGSGSGSNLEYGAGEFYLDILANQDYTVTVYAHK